MPNENDVIDKNNMLTDKGKNVFQLVLQDADGSSKMFGKFRELFIHKIQNITPIEKQFAELGDFGPEKTPQVMKALMSVFVKFVGTFYTDLASLFDFLELINNNDIESRKNIRKLADALEKNKIQSDEAIRLIVEMFNKRDEEVKLAVKKLDEQQTITKWVRRHFEDEVKEKEKI